MKASIPFIVGFALSAAAVGAVENPTGRRALAPADGKHGDPDPHTSFFSFPSAFSKLPNVEKMWPGEILNYALTIEHLQDKFYREGLASYPPGDFAKDGFQDSFYANLKEISSGATEHVRFWTNTLKEAGVTPVAECAYNFSSTDPKSFVAQASVLEGDLRLVPLSLYRGSLKLFPRRRSLCLSWHFSQYRRP